MVLLSVSAVPLHLAAHRLSPPAGGCPCRVVVIIPAGTVARRQSWPGLHAHLQLPMYWSHSFSFPASWCSQLLTTAWPARAPCLARCMLIQVAIHWAPSCHSQVSI